MSGENVTLSLMDAMTAADALVDYGIKNVDRRVLFGNIVHALESLGYVESAESLRRYAATLREHSVRVDA